MIARIWHGVTETNRANDFLDYLNRTSVPSYRAVKGNRGVQILCRAEGERTHFLLITLWDSVEALKEFAGEDEEKARYYIGDADFLIELEPRAVHYEVIAQYGDP